jgi:23S rRNA pseudouridine2457 synthase
MAKIVLFNKPYNVLCQFTDDQGRPTLADYINTPDVYPAGRLDYDSEGLVLLTDDGRLQHMISHPQRKLPKIYWAQVEGLPSESSLDAIRAGISLNDGDCRPATVQRIEEPSIWPRTPPVRIRQTIPTCWLQITISEGRNRQVRRMTAAIGHPTLRLVRASIGDWSITSLQPGESRILTAHAPVNEAAARKRTPRPRRRL